jgi:periplasmic copper chaperone A
MQPLLRCRAQIETMSAVQSRRNFKRKFQMQTRKHSCRTRAVVAAFISIISSGGAALAADAVSVSNSWVRATVPGQHVAGAYMDIAAKVRTALVAVESPVAGKAELHTMTMDGGVMKMRPLEKLELPANKTVNLKPGSYHVMLIDIKRVLKVGERVPLTLTFQDQKGIKSTLKLDAEVRAVAGGHMQH